MIVHFFVALAPKNCLRALASTTSRSDWSALISKSKSAKWSCKLVLFYEQILFSHSVIAGPVLSPCSFHSSWSCAALRQRHWASRDQRPSGSRRVRKSCPLTAPKPSAKNAVDSRVAKVGLPSSRTCVGINVRRAWRTIARGAQRYATLLSRTCGNNRNLHYFSTGGKILPTNGPRFGVQKRTPKTEAKSSGHK